MKKDPNINIDGTPSEYNIQCMVAEYIMRQYPNILWSASCGGMRTSMGTAKKMKRMGYIKGCPDIMIFETVFKDIENTSSDKIFVVQVHGLFIEMKAKGGTQKPEQKEWEKKATEQGYFYKLAYSFEEAKEIIDNYLKK